MLRPVRELYAVIALAGASCYSPTAQPGAPCTPAADNCPESQTCVAQAGGFVCSDNPTGSVDAPPSNPADAQPDGSPSVDSDGDGLLDNVDNCRMKPNPGQENEDGDAFGDVCDPCPPFADANPPIDGDSDGVSDACDPRPTQPGDTIVLFEGFRTLPTTGWFTRGTWSVANGSVTVDSMGASHLTTLGPTTQHETVSTSVKVEGLKPPEDGSIGVVDAYTNGDRHGVYCHLTLWGPGGAADQPVVINLLTAHTFEDTPFEITVGQTYSLRGRRDASTYSCVGERGATRASTPSIAVNRTAGEVGLRVSNTRATFAWLLVVSNP
jgi:hypothetical protein